MSRKRRNSDCSRLFGPGECAFCGSSCDDELIYGKLIKSDFLTSHQNCLFLSSGLSQQGDQETDEYYGFLREDIEAELRRGKKLFCSYCRKRGATIGCCSSKCKKSFHLLCGIKHGALNQFFDSFTSFCKEHAPEQSIKQIPEGFLCHICCEDVFDSLNPILYSPCCKNSWFHKICLQKYAISAGSYFFKCPLCNNSKDFIKEMEIHGIRIPEKDASWELEENAYQDLLLKPECDAASCLCSRGRKYCPIKKSGWTLLPCKYCGYHARHKNCENLKPSENSWICSECKTCELKILKNKVATEEDAETIKTSNLHSPDKNDKEIIMETIFSEPSTSQDLNVLSQVEDNIKYSESDPLHTVNINKTELLMNSNQKPKLIDEKGESLSSLVLPCHKTEDKIRKVSCTKKSDINVTEKQIVSFKDIKNVTPCSVSLKRVMPNKSNSVKREKKHKFGTPCNSSNHVCIRRYFGQECCKFRI